MSEDAKLTDKHRRLEQYFQRQQKITSQKGWRNRKKMGEREHQCQGRQYDLTKGSTKEGIWTFRLEDKTKESQNLM